MTPKYSINFPEDKGKIFTIKLADSYCKNSFHVIEPEQSLSMRRNFLSSSRYFSSVIKSPFSSNNRFLTLI
ncbi:hypothetical protein BpHYR1_015360 [Brachionus plicatilis]|uniref:Uncharacterized protein n=1 Tax=Brachionus plicatilis TaxID=10195 RepID=A0A3M7T5L4_BRAPC|nr:hypothetical protein BpHYR1_015360 [Brachionus plicatilis]